MKIELPVERFVGIRTPFYYYDTNMLRQTLDAINTETQKHDNYFVHYAVKANANLKVLHIIREAGLGIDCVSGGEIEQVLKAGFSASKIVFAGVGKSDWEIELGLDKDIFCFNVESIPELEVINEIAARKGKVATICFRINPDVGAHTHAHITTGLAENKFGIAMEDMEKVIHLAQGMKNVQFKGLHFHIGSQILEMDDFIALAHRINQLQDRLEAQGIQLEIINVGGGLGIDYEDPQANPIPNFKDYFAVYAEHLKVRPRQTVHFELGRAVVAQCGALITKVNYVKQASVKQFVIVDAGFTDLIRPALYGAHHRIINLTKNGKCQMSDGKCQMENGECQMYDVVGPICESSDTFDKDILLPKTHRGDLIAILSAGAYGEIMASCYNCRPLPQGYTSEELD
ncbi:MAG: diaminopimelate decarboxylase [Bacteroidaceae bacterium]|nr:diaminopimelate decarboxylase [Bacteroidaceae bacterium]